jgi:hypothetical protein
MSQKIGLGITKFEGIDTSIVNKFTEFHMNSEDPLFMINLHIDTKENRKGVAKSKNINIRELMDWEADHIFLFDSDCWPISPDWYLKFIETAKATRQEHLSYIPNRGNYMGNLSQEVKGQEFGDLLVYPYGWGCMQYYTKECIEIAGGYNEAFEVYGYEHLEFSMRIHNMGLTSYPYLTIKDVTKYIYSCDFEGFPEGLKPENHSLDGLDMKPILAHNFALFEKMSKNDKKIAL